jgi:uncharacterized membrane protein
MDMLSLIRNVVWNGFLALVPVALAYSILWISRLKRAVWLRNVVLVVIGVAWLIFLPNTCYLLTEWRHFLYSVDSQNLFLRSQYDKALFLQLCAMGVFYFIYSGFGMITLALAVRPIERLAAKNGAATSFWALPFFVCLSVGVYLGLVLRLNSWDPLQRPWDVWIAVADLGGRPLLTGFIVLFGVFLWVSYEAMDIWIDGLSERWSRVTGRRIHLGPKRE